jgi:hypothetical protein
VKEKGKMLGFYSYRQLNLERCRLILERDGEVARRRRYDWRGGIKL